MSDTFDKCIQKLDQITTDISKKCDEICKTLYEIHQYNIQTILLIWILWGIGIPLILFGSLIYIVRYM